MNETSKPHSKRLPARREPTEDSRRVRRLAAEQREHWNGKAGQRWAQSWEAIDQAFEAYGDAALQRLSPRLGERIIDVGCGSGACTLELAEAVGPRGEVIGIDVSRPLLEVARKRLSRYPQARFVEADAATYRQPPGQLCNALFSRFGVMFFAEPVVDFRSLGRCLQPEGRLCFACWQAPESNEWLTRIADSVVDALEEPFTLPPVSTRPSEFAFAEAGYVRQILRQAGFCEVEIEAIRLPVVFSRSSVEEAVAFVLRVGPLAPKIAAQSPEQIARIRERIRRLLSEVAEPPSPALEHDPLGTPQASSRRVQLPGAAWLVSAVWPGGDAAR